MKRPRALIITGEGLNCERETAYAFELAGAEPCLVHLGELLSRSARLLDYQILAFIGGFSNGDHLGAGTIQAARFKRRLWEELKTFTAGGRPVIGICNGFQTLVKMGLLPAPQGVQTATIMGNDSGRFEDRWVQLVLEPRSPCIWTRGLASLFLPVRHGEGKFYAEDPALIPALLRGHQVVARYAAQGPSGELTPTMAYPANPNGSLEAIAGLCDLGGTIFGLMPHPEAYLSPYNHPSWTRAGALGVKLPAEGEGVALFRNAVAHVRES